MVPRANKHRVASLRFPSCRYWLFLISLLSVLLHTNALLFDGRVFVSGGLAASMSHTLSVPIDVIKTKQQLQPLRFHQKNFPQSALLIIQEEGLSSLLAGSTPTLSGYFIQGCLKYGLYDSFKEPISCSFPNLPPIAALAIAGACAEIIAATCLCPIEAARIRMVATKDDANLIEVLQKTGIVDSFVGLFPILLKMVPYTSFQLATYESLRSTMDFSSFPDPIIAQLLCATAAAIVSSLASQPGDALLTAASQDKENNKLDLAGLFRGTQARLIQMILIVVIQLLANDAIRESVGLGAIGHEK